MALELIAQFIFGLIVVAGIVWSVLYVIPKPGWVEKAKVTPDVPHSPPPARIGSLYHHNLSNIGDLDDDGEHDPVPAAQPVSEPVKAARLDVDMELVDQDAIATYKAICGVVIEILNENGVERTPRVRQQMEDLRALTVYALGTRKYRKNAMH